MDDEQVEGDEPITTEEVGEFRIVGRGPGLLKNGERVREEIEKLGGAPCFDDRTLGRLSAVHFALNSKCFFDMQETLTRVVRRTTLRDNPPAEQQ